MEAAAGMERRLAAFGIPLRTVLEVVALPPAAVALELHTIVFSHYNDKARWALEAAGVAYREVAHLSLFHVPAMAALQRAFRVRGRRDVTSSPYSTPTLAVYAAGTRAPLLLLPDSSLIARFASAYGQRHAGAPSLYCLSPPPPPAPPTGAAADAAALAALFTEDAAVTALEQRYHDGIGISARVVAYYELLPSPSRFASLDWRNRRAVGTAAAVAHILLYPFIAVAIWLLFRISASSNARHRERLEAEFAAVEAALAADAAPSPLTLPRAPPDAAAPARVNAAHITFAALASVALAVSHAEGYGAHLIDLPHLPRDTRDWVTRLRHRPAGAAVLQLYRDSRLRLRAQRAPPPH